MFAIIDIETCGGKFDFRKGRITDICVIVHDGLQVVDKFSSLINPECYIGPMYTKLTGITNEMVADAPKFHEVAKKILELTEDKIFVAHNVSFDYNFVREEFASLGYKFRRETLCTVRLSRKLIPGRISYSLGHLCASLGIENEARHRAEGDAVATTILFDKLIELKSMNPLYKKMGIEGIMARRVDKIKEYILKKLPEECGVYYFLDKDQNIIYIGKSKNMYQRAISHFNTQENKGKKMLNDLMNVDFIETGSELVALLIEAEEIKKHKPKYNHMRKADLFTTCISWFMDSKGIINFRLTPYDESDNSLIVFNNYATARERLDSWIDEYNLCLKYCGLTEEDALCFNHQIKKCNGICAELEEIEIYNKRAKEILSKYIFEHPNFVLIDKGRNNEEKSVILIENNNYAGYGYFDATDSISTPEEMKDLVKRVPFYPDANDLIKAWMRQKSGLHRHVFPL